MSHTNILAKAQCTNNVVGSGDVGLELGTEEGLFDGPTEGEGGTVLRMVASVAMSSLEFSLWIWYRSFPSSTLNLYVAVSPGVIAPSESLAVKSPFLLSQPPRNPMSPIIIVRR